MNYLDLIGLIYQELSLLLKPYLSLSIFEQHVDNFLSNALLNQVDKQALPGFQNRLLLNNTLKACT